ncbi:MAG: hypothetical protein H6581_07680 [Bacteroidia bacterium]|nr:hypothetical protein [Bacteroidia bacterium]
MTNRSITNLLLLFVILLSACKPDENVYSDAGNHFYVQFDGRTLEAPREDGPDYKFSSLNNYNIGSIDGKTRLFFATSCNPNIHDQERFEIKLNVVADTTILTRSVEYGSYFTNENDFRKEFKMGIQDFALDEDTSHGFIFTYIDQNATEYSTSLSRNGKEKTGIIPDSSNTLEITDIIELNEPDGVLAYWVTFKFSCRVYNWWGKTKLMENGEFKGKFRYRISQ